MSLTAPIGRKRIHLTLGASFMLLGLTGCHGSFFSRPEVTSTPVATPIVVNNSPAPTTPTPHHQNPQANAIRQKAITDIVSKARTVYPGHSAVVFIDIENGILVQFEQDARFESASLVKLIILAELEREIQIGEHAPEEKLVLFEKQKVGGSGNLKNAEEGSTHTLASLAEAMITESDNTATQMLTDLLGRDKIAESAKAMGLSGTTLQRDIYDFSAIDQGRDNYITAKDAAAFMVQLAKQELPGSQAMHEILEHQKRKDMIGKGFASTVRVAHKTGELDGILHDAAIIYAPRGTVVLVVLSDRVTDKEAAKKVWAEMALKILKVYSEPFPRSGPQAAAPTLPPSAVDTFRPRP